MTSKRQYSVVLLGSGDRETGKGGSTIKEILQCSALGLISIEVKVVICNNSPKLVPGFYRMIKEHNEKFGAHVEVRTINSLVYPTEKEEEVIPGAQTMAEAAACANIIRDAGTDLYVQAGFMKRTTGALLELHGLNTHPGPIENPQGVSGVDTKGLYGIKIQKAVLDRGYPYSAYTLHTVTAQYDSGKIVTWRPVLVHPGDTPEELFRRVQIVEKACLPFDIEAYAKRRADLAV